MARLASVGMVGGLLVLILGCNVPVEPSYEPQKAPPAKDYGRPLAPGQMALRKLDPSEYPDFSPGYAYRPGLREAIQHSLAYMAKPSSQRYYPYLDISHARAVASLKRFDRLLDEVKSGEELDAAIKREFEVYGSVGWDGNGEVFFTGYYCPIFEGRKQRDAQFRYPLYKMPPDLEKDAEGRILGQRQPDGSILPQYPTRREIEEGRLLDGHEIAWVRTPFEAYVITVQGSAKLRLEDGSLYELGYAANNGHEYTSIGRKMIADGVLKPEELSLQKMIAFFNENPGQVYKYTWQNARYVFFREAPGGPFGSLNTPVTPLYTIATDKEVFPRASVAFMTNRLPRVSEGTVEQAPYAGFALDQDTGGAIRAAGRCDVYMGVGPRAEAVAGWTGAEGRLYYIFVRE